MTATATLSPEPPSITASFLATADSRVAAIWRFTAVGRLRMPIFPFTCLGPDDGSHIANVQYLSHTAHYHVYSRRAFRVVLTETKYR